MSAGKANCLVCGESIVYWEEARAVTCCVCGKEETGRCVCAEGHYVCDACHRAGGVDWVMERCLSTGSTDPVAIAVEMMDNQAIYPNGPEHHTLFGAALMAAYANAGGEIDLEKGLSELRRRSMQVPGGTCGFWGVCGAAASAGQFYSVISGSTPMRRESWARCQRLTSRILGKLADQGGPRCCKRTGFTAILETAAYVEETVGVRMDVTKEPRCRFFARNEECLKLDCPYYPGAK